MSKKTAVMVFVLVLSLATGSLHFIPSGLANFTPPPPPSIIIKNDGSVNPSTTPMVRSGNVYTLKSSIMGYDMHVQCSNIIIDGAGYAFGNNVSTAIVAEAVTNVTIRRMRIFDLIGCIEVNSSSGVTITQNIIDSGSSGLYINFSNNTSITANNLINNYQSIDMMHSTNNIISGNNIALTNKEVFLGIGVRLFFSSENLITNNNITGCSLASIDFGASSNNTIYHNNFIDNGYYYTYFDPNGNPLPHHGNTLNNYSRTQIGDDYNDPKARASVKSISVNTWYDNKEGNYWSDYVGNDTNHDGIGDTPYVIDAKVQDNYPLMAPFDIDNSRIVIPTTPQVESNSNLSVESIVVSVAIVTVVAVGVGLLVYFRKRKSWCL